jgi:hypothetical protein
VLEPPTKNAVYDKIELIAADYVPDTGDTTIAGVKTFSSDPLIPDEAYGVGWNGVLEPPTKNAVYDKIEAVVAASGSVSDTAYGAGWNGDTTVAPSKNAVYDEMELRAPKASPTFTGTPAAPTAAVGTSTTQIATTAFVRTPSVQSVASSATVTPTAADDMVIITAQAAGLTLANPTGSPLQGQKLIIRIKDNGTARGISFGTEYRALGVTLPTTTVISKTMYLGFIRNDTDTKWDLVAKSEQA